jgi:sugar O-acyltransferase (sialic acid O-acetyltransferase NeuD family)
VRTLFLCGAGNSEGVRLARAVVAAERRFDRIVLLDDDAAKQGRRLLDLAVAGTFDHLAHADPSGAAVVNLIARTTARRAAAAARIAAYGLPFATLVHPGVDVAWASVGQGALVYEHAVVSPETEVGDGSVVFMRAVVGHETKVGPGCVIAAGAVLNARVVLGQDVYVGSNASILPEVRVGDGATIGANSLVLADVPAGATVVGVPGQVLPAREAVASRTQPGKESADPGLEAKLAALWAEVLGRDVGTIGLDVGFCHAGGTSLQALRVLGLLRQRHGIDVDVPTFYRFPSARALAAHLTLPGAAAGADAAMRRGILRRARFSAEAGR